MGSKHDSRLGRLYKVYEWAARTHIDSLDESTAVEQITMFCLTHFGLRRTIGKEYAETVIFALKNPDVEWLKEI